MPSRLLAAFPAGVPVRRLPLDEAIARVEERLTGAAGAVTAELVK
jgi:ATP-dependent DNA helicase DinG